LGKFAAAAAAAAAAALLSFWWGWGRKTNAGRLGLLPPLGIIFKAGRLGIIGPARLLSIELSIWGLLYPA
jgi:hypothetical protein